MAILTIVEKKHVDIKQLSVSIEDHYWEDAEVNGVEDTDGTLIPCRNGDKWEVDIDVDTGKILNWEQGKEAKIHYKVRDGGSYSLFDSNGTKRLRLDGCYVPDILAIDGSGYGDYIIITIDKDGFIKNWEPDLKCFEDKEDN